MVGIVKDKRGTVVELSSAEKAQRDEGHLNNNRHEKILAIREEALRRITLKVPLLDTFEEVKFMALLWPMLDTASATPDLIAARNIYVYARTKITQAQSANQAQLDTYDPLTDPSWP